MVARPGAEWSQRLSAEIGQAIQRRRRDLGLLGDDLAQRCTTLGLPIPKGTISKIETGSKAFLSIGEVYVIAAALEISPSLLVAPFYRGGEVEVLPGVAVPTDAAYGWLVGETPAPVDVGDRDPDDALDLIRQRDEHNRLYREVAVLDQRINWLRRVAANARANGDVDKAEALSHDIDARSREAQTAWETLVRLRSLIRAQGNVPPAITEYYQTLEQTKDTPLWGLTGDGEPR